MICYIQNRNIQNNLKLRSKDNTSLMIAWEINRQTTKGTQNNHEFYLGVTSLSVKPL